MLRRETWYMVTELEIAHESEISQTSGEKEDRAIAARITDGYIDAVATANQLPNLSEKIHGLTTIALLQQNSFSAEGVAKPDPTSTLKFAAGALIKQRTGIEPSLRELSDHVMLEKLLRRSFSRGGVNEEEGRMLYSLGSAYVDVGEVTLGGTIRAWGTPPTEASIAITETTQTSVRLKKALTLAEKSHQLSEQTKQQREQARWEAMTPWEKNMEIRHRWIEAILAMQTPPQVETGSLIDEETEVSVRQYLKALSADVKKIRAGEKTSRQSEETREQEDAARQINGSDLIDDQEKIAEIVAALSGEVAHHRAKTKEAAAVLVQAKRREAQQVLQLPYLEVASPAAAKEKLVARASTATEETTEARVAVLDRPEQEENTTTQRSVSDKMPDSSLMGRLLRVFGSRRRNSGPIEVVLPPVAEEETPAEDPAEQTEEEKTEGTGQTQEETEDQSDHEQTPGWRRVKGLPRIKKTPALPDILQPPDPRWYPETSDFPINLDTGERVVLAVQSDTQVLGSVPTEPLFQQTSESEHPAQSGLINAADLFDPEVLRALNTERAENERSPYGQNFEAASLLDPDVVNGLGLEHLSAEGSSVIHAEGVSEQSHDVTRRSLPLINGETTTITTPLTHEEHLPTSIEAVREPLALTQEQTIFQQEQTDDGLWQQTFPGGPRRRRSPTLPAVIDLEAARKARVERLVQEWDGPAEEELTPREKRLRKNAQLREQWRQRLPQESRAVLQDILADYTFPETITQDMGVAFGMRRFTFRPAILTNTQARRYLSEVFQREIGVTGYELAGLRQTELTVPQLQQIYFNTFPQKKPRPFPAKRAAEEIRQREVKAMQIAV